MYDVMIYDVTDEQLYNIARGTSFNVKLRYKNYHEYCITSEYYHVSLYAVMFNDKDTLQLLLDGKTINEAVDNVTKIFKNIYGENYFTDMFVNDLSASIPTITNDLTMIDKLKDNKTISVTLIEND